MTQIGRFFHFICCKIYGMKYQKIKAMENAIRTALNNRNTKYINTYNNLLGYFLLFDELYQTNHYDIIKSIYENNSIRA